MSHIYYKEVTTVDCNISQQRNKIILRISRVAAQGASSQFKNVSFLCQITGNYNFTFN